MFTLTKCLFIFIYNQQQPKNSPSPAVIGGIGKDMFANAFAQKPTLETSSEGQGLSRLYFLVLRLGADTTVNFSNRVFLQNEGTSTLLLILAFES